MRKALFAAAALLFAARVSAAIPTSERDALIALYQSTNGANWSNRANWLGSTGTECTWFGVVCDFETQSNVLHIELPDNHLDGPLPSSLRNLTKLTALYLTNNHLTGNLPPELGELSNLDFLYLQSNALTGPFPPQYGNLKKLAQVSLYQNQLSGPLPAQIGDMTAIEELSLSDNAFTGPIPADLARLANAKVIELSVNQLTGSIPPAIGTLPKLERFTAGDNHLSGPIPPQLGDASTLRELYLGYNELTGPIPSTFGKLHALEVLEAAHNHLSGPLPETLGDLASIQQIALTENELSGLLPASIVNLTTLEEINLGDNQLTGTISPLFSNLTRLHSLRLYGNQFSGAIPSSLGSLAQLDELSLERNRLTGTIPIELSHLSNLTALSLSDNQLSGTIPRELRALAKLKTLALYGNELEGTIPPELGDLSELTSLLIANNQLHGSIPDALRKLTKLEHFSADENELSGPLPSWIGEWTPLMELTVRENQLSGALPAGLGTLENLAFLDLALNQFTGNIVDFTNLTNLVYLNVPDNDFSGRLPASIGGLKKVTYASFGHNHFSGPIPAEIGGMTGVEYLDLSENAFDGAIPPQLSQLGKAYNISLHSNHLSGPLPKELGDLTALQYLSVSFNALRGAIPVEILRMTGLIDHSSDFSFNGLYATDERVRTFVNLKQGDGDFEATQTVMPTQIHLVDTTDRSATLAWEPIRYNYYGGGYQVTASTTLNGPPAVVATTSSKSLDSITVRNLNPATTYFFTVSTVSHPISGQENLIVSDRSSPVQGTTKARVIAPPDVVITDAPSGMVQIDGVEVEADSFTVTNFGDVATAITLEKNESFFTVAPTQFSLAAGASQIITLHSTAQNPGSYYGYVSVNGVGAPDDLLAEVVLLSSARPAGRVVATPLATRIELAGEPGSDQVGTVQFRNSGTARLTGIIVSDQPWVIVPAEPFAVDPGGVGSVNFRVARSRRPAATEGGLVANLTLVYVSGGETLRYKDFEALDTSGVSVSKVTIVDVTKPPVSTGPIPALGPGQLAYFIPGVATAAGSHADVSIINAAGASAINDLKLYFTSGPQTSIASLASLGFAQAVSLPNVVNSIYGNPSAIGTLQIRSGQAGSLATEAKVTAVVPGGTYSGAIPVFRGDRSIGTGASLYLTGLSAPGDLLVQETSGGSTNVHVELRDASGTLVGTSDRALAGYALLELTNTIPTNVTTAVVRNLGPGQVTAYARLRDANGDTWSVVDWSRFYRYTLQDAVRIPFADGAHASGTKRRSVRPLAVATSSTTDVVLYNAGSTEGKATMKVVDASGHASERTITVAAGATVTMANAGSLSTSPVASLVIVPTHGDLAITARTHHASGGSAIPVLPATAGLRLGQSQVFAGLDDSTAVRTSYGLTESSGASVKVRVRIIIDESNPLTATITSKTYTLAAGEQVFLPELVRSFAGAQRDTLFGDLHNLTLEFEVIEGDGSVVPFVIATDIASGDSNVVVQ